MIQIEVTWFWRHEYHVSLYIKGWPRVFKGYTRKSSAIKGAKRLAKVFNGPVKILIDGEVYE